MAIRAPCHVAVGREPPPAPVRGRPPDTDTRQAGTCPDERRARLADRREREREEDPDLALRLLKIPKGAVVVMWAPARAT
jgi:hypothetical protein